MQATKTMNTTKQTMRRGLLAALSLAIPIIAAQAQAMPVEIPAVTHAAGNDAALCHWAGLAAKTDDAHAIGDLMQQAMYTQAASLDGAAAKCRLALRMLDVAGWHWTMEYMLFSINLDAERLS